MESAGAKLTENTPPTFLQRVFRWLLLFLEYAYLMRFPLIAALLLAAVIPGGYFFAPAVFVGLFDAGGFWSFAFVVWLEFQMAWTVMVTTRLFLAYGPDRFDSLQKLGARVPGKLSSLHLVGFGALAIPALVVTWMGSLDLSAGQKLLGSAVGILLSFGVLAMAAMLHFRFEHGGGRTAETVLPSFGMIKPAQNDENWEKDRVWLWKWMDRQFTRLPNEITVGLVRSNTDGSKKWVRSGFELAFSTYVVLLVVYGAIGIGYSPILVSPERQPAALFFALFLLIMLTWFLSGASFVLDRLRLPVLTSILFLSLLTGIIHTDHVFQIVRSSPHPELPAADVIKAWDTGVRGGKGKPIVVIATAGGGIQAAAWTTQVLTGLQDECKGADFSASVLLVSSVSGGSVGTMYYLAPYSSIDGSYPRDPESLNKVRYNSTRSSLSSVGWGLLYPDAMRTLPGIGLLTPQHLDRGWAIENAWVTGWDTPPNMSNWRSDVHLGRRPSVLFNATSAEGGERFVIGTTELKSAGGIQFGRDFDSWDMPVATAARLSATFPYVSPMARPSGGNRESDRVHVADGGYYDNSGVVGALAWLDDAATQLQGRTVLFITIDSESGESAPGQSWSWQRQISAPIETILHMRTSSQRYRAGFETNLMVDSLNRRGVKVVQAPFLFSGSAPLSWHLNSIQKTRINDAWATKPTERTLESKNTVLSTLGCVIREK